MTDIRYAHVLRAVFGEPWALKEEYFRMMCSIVRDRAMGIKATDEEIQAAIRSRRDNPVTTGNGVAVLPLYGLMSQRANMMSEMSGGTSTEQFGAMFAAAMADPNVGSIVIDVDSPGGEVFGVQELWDTMMSQRGRKPVTAVANSMMASAAYYVASAADSISVTPGGLVGSIGVFMEHVDLSRALESEGVTPTLISAGKKKVQGNPYEPLTEGARADLQAKVDSYYNAFVNSVARGRGVTAAAVRGGFGEGDVVTAQVARQLGMVDRIETLDQAIMRSARPGNGPRADLSLSDQHLEMLLSEQVQHADAIAGASLLERRRAFLTMASDD